MIKIPAKLSLSAVILSLSLLSLVGTTANGQQPFVTDNSDVTPKRKFHLQIGNEYDILQRSSYPALRQNTASFELDYGLFEDVEIGFSAPLITILNSHIVTPSNVSGLSDSTLHLKYNFHKERENSKMPALSISAVIQFPTGDVTKQLGSGLTDYYINGILQKSVTPKTTFRLNGGILFAGNEQSGVLGIKAHGRVFTAGGSLVKQFSPKLQLGVELTGALQSNFQLGKGQLQTLFGGNYLFKKNMSFDFGLIAGKYAASPRAGIQLGISIDF
jgi:hypothetical protein